MSACEFNWDYTMIILTISRLNCLDHCNCKLVTWHTSFVPLGPPDPSFFPIIVLGKVWIFLICHYLAVSIVFFAQRGDKIGNLNAWCNESHNHILVLGSEATDLMLLSYHGQLQALSLLGRGLSASFICHWDVFPISLCFLAFLPEPFLLLGGEHLVDTSQILGRGKALVCAIPVLKLDAAKLTCDLFCSGSLWTMVVRYEAQFWKVIL